MESARSTLKKRANQRRKRNLLKMKKISYFVMIAALTTSMTLAGPPVQKANGDKPAAALSMSLRMVPNSDLDEVLVSNGHKTKRVTGIVAITKSYTVSMPDKTETKEVNLAPGEKIMICHINSHYVKVRMDVRSAAFGD